MWPDKETNIDYLNFGYMVDMVADIATNRDLSPSTVNDHFSVRSFEN
jgi:hypothetical protein